MPRISRRFALNVFDQRPGLRLNAVLMSVWRTCWQQGRSALDYLSQILRGTQSQDCAPSGLNVRLADSAVAL